MCVLMDWLPHMPRQNPRGAAIGLRGSLSEEVGVETRAIIGRIRGGRKGNLEGDGDIVQGPIVDAPTLIISIIIKTR